MKLHGKCWGRDTYNSPWEQGWCAYDDEGFYTVRYDGGDEEHYLEEQLEREVDGEYITFDEPLADEPAEKSAANPAEAEASRSSQVLSSGVAIRVRNFALEVCVSGSVRESYKLEASQGSVHLYDHGEMHSFQRESERWDDFTGAAESSGAKALLSGFPIIISRQGEEVEAIVIGAFRAKMARKKESVKVFVVLASCERGSESRSDISLAPWNSRAIAYLKPKTLPGVEVLDKLQTLSYSQEAADAERRRQQFTEASTEPRVTLLS